MNEPPEMRQTGRVWKFGDNINTDLIQPSAAFKLPQSEQHKAVFSTYRPGWVDLVRPGDIIVAGFNFGVGSGRTIGAYLRTCGITAVIAESINGLGLRNCINFQLPAMECPGVFAIFDEGHSAYVNFTTGEVRNETTGRAVRGTPLPDLFRDVIRSGGIVQMLIDRDLIERSPTNASTQ